MLGKRIINATSGVACTTDTVQILDGVPFDSIATYEFESDASNSVDTGYIGKGAIFNGTSSKVSNVYQIDFGSSISMWVYVDNTITTGTYYGLWTQGDDAAAGYIGTRYKRNSGNNYTIEVITREGNDYIYRRNTSSTWNEGWNHFVFIINTTTGCDFYLNGNNGNFSNWFVSGTFSNVDFSTKTAALGLYHLSTYYKGQLDEVRYYNKELSASEITTLYEETASSTISISGLQAHYKFEGDATDETGNYDGTASNITYNEYDGIATNVTYATGKFGNAAVFNGSSSFVQIDSIPTNNIFSLSFWVNANDPNSDNDLFHFYDSTNHIAANNIGIANAGTQFGWFPHTSTGGAGFTGISAADTNALFDGSWHHVVIASDADSFANTKIYIDGNEKTLTISNSYTTSVRMEGTLYIGKRQDGYGDFNGKLDQVRIYDQKLSAADVSTLYAETLATSQTNISLNAPSGVAYYKMNDATDETGSYDGTASNVNFNVAGKFGNAGYFNGSSSYISTGIPIDSYSSRSYSFWFLQNSNTPNSRVFGGASGSATNGGMFRIRTDNNQINYYSINNTTYTFTTSISNDVWTHIALTDSGTNVKLYINNSEITNPSTASYSTVTNTNLQIGRGMLNSGSFGNYTNGSIDQVRIFDRAITSDEVTTLYDEVYCQPTIVPTDYFEPVIYTGTSGTQSITSLDFQPDFTWIKSRSNITSHVLSDSVRGANLKLRSNSTGAEAGTDYGVVTSFDSNGFTVGGTIDTGDVSFLNRTYVAWNWKAPLANLSTGFNGSSSYISTTLPNNDIEAFSFWMYFVSGTTANRPLGSTVSSSGGNLSVEVAADGSIACQLQNLQTVGGVGVLGSTGWKNIYYDTNRDLYINGVLQSTTDSSTSFPASNLLIGALRTTYGFFDGEINQVRAFNTTLTASQIADLYAEPLESNNTLNYPAGAGCIAAYPLQTDAVDLSGNYNGTPSNVTFGKPGYLTENTEGTTTSTVAASVDSGFSIVEYTAGGASTVGHGLSQAPELIITKNLDISEQWFVYAEPVGTQKFLGLNTTSAATSNSGVYTNIGADTFTNNISGTSRTYINYCFHSVDGYSKIGSYVGTNTRTGIVTGFRPAFVMIKRTDASSPWFIIDNRRFATYQYDKYLLADSSAIEGALGGTQYVSFLSNGFSVETGSGLNGSGNSYIFMAFAEENVQPKPELANSFNVVTYTGNGTDITVNTGLKPDMVWIKERTSTSAHRIVDSVRGDKKRIFPNATNAESEVAAGEVLLDNGFQVGADNGSNQNGEDYVAWAWKASNDSTINNDGSISSIVSANPAAGFSIAKWQSNGIAGATVGHGVDAPEMIIVKDLDNARNWLVYHKDMGATKGMQLNTTDAAATYINYWNNTAPTSSVFSLGSWANESGSNGMIAYCFSSVDGYQKVGSYSMTSGSAVSVDVGFVPRFVLLKETTRDAGWIIVDNVRNLSGNYKARIYPSSNSAESTGQQIQFIGNTFNINWGSTGNNDNGGTGVYLAIA